MRCLLIPALLFCFSCSVDSNEESKISNETEVANLNWQSNPDYGYYKSKTINGFKIGVTYLPGDHLLEKELAKEGALLAQTDSIEDFYKNSVHFTMEIESDGVVNKGNFMFNDVYNQNDFSQNVNYYNFSIMEDVQVHVNGSPFQVVLSNMENTYNLDDKRKIHFVAVPKSEQDNLQNKPIENLLFVYDDEKLGVGYTKFRYEANEFKPIPNKI